MDQSAPTTLAEHYGDDHAALSAMIAKLEAAGVAITPNQSVVIADGYVQHEGVMLSLQEHAE